MPPLLIYLPFVVWMSMIKMVQDELCPVFWLNRPARDIDMAADYDPTCAVISLRAHRDATITKIGATAIAVNG
jgi:hypothetical protein